MNKILLTLLFAAAAAANVQGQTAALRPLHAEHNNLCDDEGNVVVLRGVMDTPSPYFNNYRWGRECTGTTIKSCINYFGKLFSAITDTAQGAHCNLFRLHLDPCWTNDPNKVSDGKESGEADISRFSEKRLKVLMQTLFWPIAGQAKAHGLYVIMRPPGVCPQNLSVGDYYQDYLMTVWGTVTKNDSVLKNAGVVGIELANEPVHVYNRAGQADAKALHDYFQPIVDTIRANGFTGMIWVPGSGWQSNYADYAKYPIAGDNIGYAVHDYPGWYDSSDSNPNYQGVAAQFKKQVPVVMTNPIVITEVDWSPEVPGKGHYDEHGNWVSANMGTWATATTSRWGRAFRALTDYYGNISMTLSGTGCYIDIDRYLADGTVTPAFGADPEACAAACFEWYDYYSGQKAYANDTIVELVSPADSVVMAVGTAAAWPMRCLKQSGNIYDVTLMCRNKSTDPAVMTISGDSIVAKSLGACKLIFAFTDQWGESVVRQIPVRVVTAAGIEPVSGREVIKTEYYDLRGQRISRPKGGLCFVKRIFMDKSCEISKIMSTFTE